jgi:hypothetical protein
MDSQTSCILPAQHARLLFGPLSAERQTALATILSYTFRIRFNRSPRETIQTEASELTLPLPDDSVSLVLKAPRVDQSIRESLQLVLVGQRYDSEKEATEAGLRFQDALMVTLARARIGADFGQRAAKGVVTEYGLRLLEQQSGQRTLNNVHGLMVFPSEPKPRFVSTTAEMIRYVNAEGFQKTFLTSIQSHPSLGSQDLLAHSLFNASFFQPTSDSRFLLLVMAVEALLTPTSRSPETRQHVDKLIEQTHSAPLPDNEKKSMIGALRWLHNESINQSGRRLASNRLHSRSYNERSAPDFFSYCYQLRSNLVHGKLPVPTFDEIGSVAGTLEVFVADLLTIPILGAPA